MRSDTLNGDQTVVASRKIIPDIYIYIYETLNETLFIIHCNYHNCNADRNSRCASISRLTVFFHARIANYIGNPEIQISCITVEHS